MTNYGSNNISAYTINASSGALTPVTGSPFKTSVEPIGVAVDPKGKFAYVACYAVSHVYAYAINPSSGALTRVKGSPFKTTLYPVFNTVDPTGRYAYVTTDAIRRCFWLYHRDKRSVEETKEVAVRSGHRTPLASSLLLTPSSCMWPTRLPIMFPAIPSIRAAR